MKPLTRAGGILLSGALFFLSYQSAAPASDRDIVQRAVERRLWTHPAWRALLHEQKSIFFRRVSGIDDPGFFFSPRGRTDFKAELIATLEAFIEDGGESGDASPACEFPARFHWLDEQLNLSAVRPAGCPRFEKWKNNLRPESVSLVFASYYFNNPASMYGHTFLKLERGGDGPSSDLLDYTVNYAADTDTANGVMFAIKGLLGGYRGTYTTDPFYFKIQKYNNIEARDMWVYPLNLSNEERDRLVRHLWEIGPRSTTYFFFNRNCSFQILPLLETARPGSRFSDDFVFRAVPVDTVQELLTVPGLVGEPRLRPAHTRLMKERRDRLSKEDQKTARALAEGRLEPAEAHSAEVLDSALDLWRTQTGFYRDLPEEDRNRERALLLARKGKGVKSLHPTFSVENVGCRDLTPTMAHPAGKFSIGGGVDKEKSFVEVGIRSALHDLESDPGGYVEGSQLEMFNIRVRIREEDNDPFLEEFTFIHIKSLAPLDPWIRSPSWAVRAALDVAHDIPGDPDDNLTANFNGGTGLTWALPLSGKPLLYSLAKVEAAGGSVFRDGYRAGAGGEAGVVWRLTDDVRIHTLASVFRFPAGHPGNRVRFYGAASLDLSQRWETRLIGLRENGWTEGTLSLIYYW